jgi:hypothetical protein
MFSFRKRHSCRTNHLLHKDLSLLPSPTVHTSSACHAVATSRPNSAHRRVVGPPPCASAPRSSPARCGMWTLMARTCPASTTSTPRARYGHACTPPLVPPLVFTPGYYPAAGGHGCSGHSGYIWHAAAPPSSSRRHARGHASAAVAVGGGHPPPRHRALSSLPPAGRRRRSVCGVQQLNVVWDGHGAGSRVQHGHCVKRWSGGGAARAGETGPGQPPHARVADCRASQLGGRGGQSWAGLGRQGFRAIPLARLRRCIRPALPPPPPPCSTPTRFPSNLHPASTPA